MHNTSLLKPRFLSPHKHKEQKLQAANTPGSEEAGLGRQKQSQATRYPEPQPVGVRRCAPSENYRDNYSPTTVVSMFVNLSTHLVSWSLWEREQLTWETSSLSACMGLLACPICLSYYVHTLDICRGSVLRFHLLHCTFCTMLREFPLLISGVYLGHSGQFGPLLFSSMCS